MRATEAEVRKKVIKLLRSAGAEVIAIPNELVGRLNVKVSGYTKGAPDLVVAFCGQVFFVEVKSANGRLRPEQRKLHERLRALGAKVFVVSSEEDLQPILAEMRISKDHG